MRYWRPFSSKRIAAFSPCSPNIKPVAPWRLRLRLISFCERSIDTLVPSAYFLFIISSFPVHYTRPGRSRGARWSQLSLPTKWVSLRDIDHESNDGSNLCRKEGIFNPGKGDNLLSVLCQDAQSFNIDLLTLNGRAHHGCYLSKPFHDFFRCF